MFKVGLAFGLMLAMSLIALGQTPPPSNTYPYCEAKAHEHSNIAVTYGYYRSRWLINSDCNNTANLFYGNTITIQQWSQQKTFWYDWSADPRSGEKISVWMSSMWGDPLTVTYDQECMMVVSITSPAFP